MVQALLAIHLLTALIIIGLVLMQQGKGAETGASFGGGASQTMFGSAGSWNFFSRMTAIFATIFFITSIALAVVAKNSAEVDESYLPEMEKTELPQSSGESEIPATNTSGSANEIPVVEESQQTNSIPAGSDIPVVSEEPTVQDKSTQDIPEQSQEKQ